MQTGNTVFIGLGASQNSRATRPYGWAKSLSSLVAFLLGSLFFSRLGILLGSRDRPRRRLTFTLSFALQTVFILLSAILLQSNVVESRLEYIGEDIDWLHLVPIVLLSFQAPGQTFAGRQLGTPEVSMVVITSMIYDFASDFRLFKKNNAPRNRRFGGFVSLLIGAICGGWVTKNLGHITATVWSAAAIKAAITISWTVWPCMRSV